MRHRHLNHEDYTLAAVDDIIERGGRQDWAELTWAAQDDPEVMARIEQIVRARCVDPSAQRYHFWRLYVEELKRLA